jgi:hypothetical protein
MSFYKELVPFIEYIHSIRKLKTYLSFDIVFPTKWAIPKSLVEEGQIVGFEAEDQNFKGISFVTPITDKDISNTLIKIAKIIKLNKEKEFKEKLFKQTVEQLKQTFEKTDLDKLQNLYFDFDEGDTSLNIDEEEEPNLELHEQHEPVTESHEDGGE